MIAFAIFGLLVSLFEGLKEAGRKQAAADFLAQKREELANALEFELTGVSLQKGRKTESCTVGFSMLNDLGKIHTFFTTHQERPLVLEKQRNGQKPSIIRLFSSEHKTASLLS